MQNHRLEDRSGKFRQVETSRSTHLKAEGKPRASETVQHVHEIVFALKGKLTSAKVSIRFSRQSLARTNFGDKFPSLHVIQTGGEHGRCPNAPLYVQRSTEWNEEEEEFARHKAYTFHKELFNIHDPTKMSTTQTSLFPQRQSNTNGLTIHTTEWMYIVDSDASLHTIRLDFVHFVEVRNAAASSPNIGEKAEAERMFRKRKQRVRTRYVEIWDQLSELFPGSQAPRYLRDGD